MRAFGNLTPSLAGALVLACCLQAMPAEDIALDGLELRTWVRAQHLSVKAGAGVARCTHPEAVMRFSCGSARGDRIMICEAYGRRGLESGQIHLEMQSVSVDVASVSIGPPRSALRYNHYMRFRTDYLEIAARSSESEYRVFRHHEDSLVSYGVVIRKRDEPEIRVDCAGEVLDQLSGLSTVLECDRENALGCGVPEPSAPRFD